MNHKLGKIGYQEALCLAALAASASAIFVTDGAALYGLGNSAYLSMPIAAGMALLFFLMVSGMMRRHAKEDFWELTRFGFGPIVGRLCALFFSVLLIVCAAAVMERFTLMLGRFVYVDADESNILFYMVGTVFLLAWLGFEGLGRSARLFVWVAMAALLGALLLATFTYEPYRLSPVLGDGTQNMLNNALHDSLLFFPALLGLLIVARGVHGEKPARRIGIGVAAASGLLAAICQLCLGMTYSYRDLGQMHSPMYRLTMAFSTSGYFSRMDLLLLFGWTLGGIIGCGFYVYAGAYLFARAFNIVDIRPVIAAFTACAGCMALLSHSNAPWAAEMFTSVHQFGYLAAGGILFLLLFCCALHKKAKGNRETCTEDTHATP